MPGWLRSGFDLVAQEATPVLGGHHVPSPVPPATPGSSRDRSSCCRRSWRWPWPAARPARPSPEGSDAAGIEIKAGQFSWTAAEVETEILGRLAAAHPELGVSKVTPVRIDPAAGWLGLQRGDLDLLTEVNLPNQQAFADKAKDEVNLVSQTYDGAAQGWFVPKYLVDGPTAPAAGLTRIDQLNDYADKVGGALYDADPGWVTTQQNTKRLAAYGLTIQHKPSSEAALIAQLDRQYKRQEPILLYFYHPHWVFQDYDLVQLEEPNPYKDGCFTGADDKCAIPTLAAWIGARKDLETRAPKFYAALAKIEIPLTDIEAMLNQVDQEKKAPADVAQAWIDEHKTEIDTWVA